jgi:general secretion pathway protein G
MSPILVSLRNFRGHYAQSPSGFTLIEIMVVVVILAVLGALVVPQILENVDKARLRARRATFGPFRRRWTCTAWITSSIPTTEQGLQALVKQPGRTRPSPIIGPADT